MVTRQELTQRRIQLEQIQRRVKAQDVRFTQEQLRQQTRQERQQIESEFQKSKAKTLGQIEKEFKTQEKLEKEFETYQSALQQQKKQSQYNLAVRVYLGQTTANETFRAIPQSIKQKAQAEAESIERGASRKSISEFKKQFEAENPTEKLIVNVPKGKIIGVESGSLQMSFPVTKEGEIVYGVEKIEPIKQPSFLKTLDTSKYYGFGYTPSRLTGYSVSVDSKQPVTTRGDSWVKRFTSRFKEDIQKGKTEYYQPELGFVSAAPSVPEVSKSTVYARAPTPSEKEVIEKAQYLGSTENILNIAEEKVVTPVLEYKPIKEVTTKIRNIPVIKPEPSGMFGVSTGKLGESLLFSKEGIEYSLGVSREGWQDISKTFFESAKEKRGVTKNILETGGYLSIGAGAVSSQAGNIIGYTTVPVAYSGAELLALEEKKEKPEKYIQKELTKQYESYEKQYAKELKELPEGYELEKKLTKQQFITKYSKDIKEDISKQIRREQIIPFTFFAGGITTKAYPYLKSGTVKTVELTGKKGKEFIKFEEGLLGEKGGYTRFTQLKKQISKSKFEKIEKLLGEVEKETAKRKTLKGQIKYLKTVEKKYKLTPESTKKIAKYLKSKEIIKEPVVKIKIDKKGQAIFETVEKPITVYTPPKKPKKPIDLSTIGEDFTVRTTRYLPKELPKTLETKPTEIKEPLGESKFAKITGQVMEEGKFGELGDSKFKDITETTKTRFDLKLGDIEKQKEIEVLKMKQPTKQKETQLTKLALKTIQKQQPRELELLKQPTKQKLSSKEMLKSLLGLKQKTVQKQKARQRSKLIERAREIERIKPKKPKVPVPIIDFEPSSKEIIKEKAKDVLDDFKVFVKKAGKDIELGEFETLGEAKRELKGELLGTLRAGGFITEKGKKIRIDLGRGFRPSKLDPLRVVQKKRLRFGTPLEVKEAQFFRKGGFI